VDAAMASNKVAVDDHTAHHLVNLLTDVRHLAGSNAALASTETAAWQQKSRAHPVCP